VKRKLSTSVKTTVKVSQRITLVKYAVAGTLLITLLGGAVFLYFNLANSEHAEAGNRPKGGEEELQNAHRSRSLIDLSQLSLNEMELLSNRDFVRDTTKKTYASVKWNLNNSLSHLTLEVANSKNEYSLEIFDQNGFRVLYFVNLTDEKFFVDKMELLPNHEYSYLVKNTANELYAGNLKFN